MKAQTIDRIELTRRKMAFKEAMKHTADTPAYPGAEEHTEPQFHGEKCPFNSEKCSFNDNICPFCGGEADLRYCLGDNYSVLCEKCLARITTYNTVKKAVRAWNKRTN